MKKQSTLFIFDFDGVIADSVSALYSVYLDFLNQFGIKGTRKEFNSLNGPKITEIIRILKNKHHLGPDEKELRIIYFQKLSNLYGNIRLIDGIKDILNKLKNDRFPIALASSSKKSEIHRVLEKFELTPFFRMIVAGEDVNLAKPSPEIYLKIKQRYPDYEYFVVEDSEHGLQAAMDAGMKTIFYNPEHNSVTKTVDYEIYSLYEIQNILTEIHLNCFTVSTASNMKLEVIDHDLNLTPAQASAVEDIWKKESKQRNLFNGQLLCRYSHKQRGKNLYIQCFFSEYKYFFANINNPELALNFSSVSVSGIILDEKKNTIIGKRNNVTEYKGFYELIPSGSIDADRVRRGSVTFKDQIIEEFEEETGLDRRTIKRIEPICVIFDKTHMVYDICMKISIRGFLHHLLTSDSNREYKQVQIINLENIHTKINIDNMVPTSQVMLNNLLKK